ncbi:glycosyltransferase family 1 protein, partial [Hansschlegelia beijingensis]
MSDATPLRIVHLVRSPVGGIFRHIGDLIGAQAAAGHSVGLVCDSTTGGAFEEARIALLRPKLALG